MDNKKDNKLAVAYYRSAAFNERSIRDQKKIVTKFANDHHIEIIREEIDNGYSAADMSRPGLCDFLRSPISNNESEKFEYVIVKDLSRLARSLSELASLDDRMKKAGKKFLIADES